MIKQIIPQEHCLNCRGCCRFKEDNSVWLPCLLEEEIQYLLDKKIPLVSISIDRKIQPIPCPSGEGFICAFLDHKKNLCRIYDFRPFECQLYPFLLNLRGKKVILTVDLNCPYIAEHLNSKEFKEYIDYLTAHLNSKEQLRIFKDNPRLLQTYEKVAEIVELNLSQDETKQDSS